MTCMTYDKLYLDGMTQPTIGSFTLKFGEILAKVRYNDQKTLEDAKNINLMMNNIIKGKMGRDSDKTVLQILNRQQEIYKKRKALATQVVETKALSEGDTSQISHSHSGRCEDHLHGDDGDIAEMDEAEREAYKKKFALKR